MIFNLNSVESLKIGGYVNYSSDFLGLDSIEQCHSKKYFNSYPYPVTYHFNELGYREVAVGSYKEDAIIAIGDSFTVGLGLPAEYTYPKLLEKQLGHQVLNFGMNGASNNWIARKLKVILEHFNPLAIIVHYTFSHRRERNETTWFDDERTLCDPLPDNNENYKNWADAHKQIQELIGSIPVCYSHIPNWHPGQSSVKQLDYARDYFHYGIATNNYLATFYADQINRQLVR